MARTLKANVKKHKKHKEHKEPVETVRMKANYHRPVNGRWVADFQGVVSLRMLFSKSCCSSYFHQRTSHVLPFGVLPLLQLRGLVFKKGNADGTDMNAIVFNGLGGKDLMNAPIPRGLPYARQENTIYIKTSVVNSEDSTKGRFPFGLQFNTVHETDLFEEWYTDITLTNNCFRCNAPSTLPLLHAANAQVDAATRSPPSARLIARAKSSPLLKDESMSSAPVEALLSAFNAVDPYSKDNIQPQKTSNNVIRSTRSSVKRKRDAVDDRSDDRVVLFAEQLVQFERERGVQFDIKYVSKKPRLLQSDDDIDVVSNQDMVSVTIAKTSCAENGEATIGKNETVGVSSKKADDHRPSPLAVLSNETSPKSDGSSRDDEDNYNSYDGTPVYSQKLYWHDEDESPTAA